MRSRCTRKGDPSAPSPTRWRSPGRRSPAPSRPPARTGSTADAPPNPVAHSKGGAPAAGPKPICRGPASRCPGSASGAAKPAKWLVLPDGTPAAAERLALVCSGSRLSSSPTDRDRALRCRPSVPGDLRCPRSRDLRGPPPSLRRRRAAGLPQVRRVRAWVDPTILSTTVVQSTLTRSTSRADIIRSKDSASRS